MSKQPPNDPVISELECDHVFSNGSLNDELQNVVGGVVKVHIAQKPLIIDVKSEPVVEDDATSELIYLAKQLQIVRAAEENQKAKRIVIEEKIAARIPGPDRGQKTVALPDGKKITVERGFNYKVDATGIRDSFKEEFQPLKVKTTYELDVTAYEKYREDEPQFFDALSKFVTVTPKKISVQVKDAK